MFKIVFTPTKLLVDVGTNHVTKPLSKFSSQDPLKQSIHILVIELLKRKVLCLFTLVIKDNSSILIEPKSSQPIKVESFLYEFRDVIPDQLPN